MRIERVLFAKVELWVVLLLAVLGFVGMVGFGAIVLDRSEGKGRTGRVGDVALALASTPGTFAKLVENKDRRLAQRTERFAGKSGWATGLSGGAAASSGYLLLSRYSGDENRALIELLDLSDYSVVHQWRPDADQIFAGVNSDMAKDTADIMTTFMFKAMHPLLLPDGGLVIHGHQTPLARIDACGHRLWVQDHNVFHHSTEFATDRTIWSPTRIHPTNPENGVAFFEDALTRVSQDGTILSESSLPEILIENGLMGMMFTSGGYLDDGLHLNDVAPVLQDGQYWKKGDLFLSLRHKSTVMLYRPATNKIVWMKQGPWLAQHDVDILDDHRIAVFNNNAFDRGKGWYIRGSNEIVVYDFATDTTSSPFDDAFESLKVMTLTEGLFDFTESGHVIVEEENSGRLLILDGSGNLAAEFVNRSADGKVFGLGWSRYIPQVEGDALRSVFADGGSCEEPSDAQSP